MDVPALGSADAPSMVGLGVSDGAAPPAAEPIRIAVVANTSWYVHNFRLRLMRELRADGHVVAAVAGRDDYAGRLEQAGFEHYPVDFDVSGTLPWRESATVRQLRRVLTVGRFDVVLSFTPKGNIYSALALRGNGAALIMNVSGLGRAFTSPGPVTMVVKWLYRMTTGRAAWVFFQNEDDRALFLRMHLVAPEKTSRLPGSGVDLQSFAVAGLPTVEDPPRAMVFLMVARLLWDKGVAEYVEAAHRIAAEYPAVRFRLLGPVDESSSSGVASSEIGRWKAAGVVDYLGATDDVRPFIRAADCVVLPSYREGVPRSLLEAAAMGRPIVATDVPGCRDVVEHGVTGLLCEVRSADSLAQALKRIVLMSPSERTCMGLAGRALVERQFDERIVLHKYRDAVAAACAERWRRWVSCR